MPAGVVEHEDGPVARADLAEAPQHLRALPEASRRAPAKAV
ncbi:hypothetical protein [Nannocystis pusilla]